MIKVQCHVTTFLGLGFVIGGGSGAGRLITIVEARVSKLSVGVAPDNSIADTRLPDSMDGLLDCIKEFDVPFIHSSIYISIHISIYPFIYLYIHSSIYISIHHIYISIHHIYISIHLSIYPFIISIYPFIYLYIHSSIYISIHHIYISIHLSIYPFIYLYIHSSYLYIHSSIYISITPCTVVVVGCPTLDKLPVEADLCSVVVVEGGGGALSLLSSSLE